MSSPSQSRIKFKVHGNRVTVTTIRRDSWGREMWGGRRQFTISKSTFLKALDEAEFTVKWKELDR